MCEGLEDAAQMVTGSEEVQDEVKRAGEMKESIPQEESGGGLRFQRFK